MNIELKNKIDEVASCIGNKQQENALMAEAFAMAVTAEEKKEAGQYLMQAIAKRKRTDIDAKAMFGEVGEAVSMAYVAQRYFGKNKAWIYQRLNKSIVNGKPACFSEKELTVLADSFKDIGQKLLDVSTNISLSLK